MHSREWSLVVRPVKNPGFSYLFSREGEMLLCYRLIVPKRTHRTRKELSPLSICHHLLDYLRNQLFILFLGILLVEDAVGFIMESNATKTMIKIDASFGIIAVPEFCIIETE